MTPIRILILGSTASYQKKIGSWMAKDGRHGTHAYDTASYRDWRSYARGKAAEQMAGHAMLTGPVLVEIDLYKQIPASFSHKKQEQARRGWIRPTTRPDCSNHLKAIEDAALTGIVIRDDADIVSVRIDKWFDDQPRCEIVVRPFEPKIVDRKHPSLFAEAT